MKRETLTALTAARLARRPALLLKDLEDANREQVLSSNGPFPAGLEDMCYRVLRSGKAVQASLAGRRLLINPYLPPVRIVVIGAVHISQALAPMAALAGLDLEIIDPRGGFAAPERFVGVPLVADWPQDALARRPLDGHCALVALSHDPKLDDPGLEAALAARCFYIGALGSRKSHAARLERLQARGHDPMALARIRGPVGLSIGAAQPAEIAVSILAEVIRTLRLGDDPAVAEGSG